MTKLIINGPCKIKGRIKVSGAKNVAMKVILSGLLTDKAIYVKNIPLISSVYATAELVQPLGVKVTISKNNSLKIQGDGTGNYKVPLEFGGTLRTATMVIGPLLARCGQAIVPNPGGCRIGKRSINWHIDSLQALGAKIKYKDGFFIASAKQLHGTTFRFKQNTHTGTETMILAAVLANGETVIENAAAEPEIDNLISLLNNMGAKIKRIKPRIIVVKGVKKLNGTHFSIMPDRNEVVTFAVAAIASGGDLEVDGAQQKYLSMFLTLLDKAQAGWRNLGNDRIQFFVKKKLNPTNITTLPYPGFMTDWQAPWAILMTQAHGQSIIKETIFEDRFGYVAELKKMGAKIEANINNSIKISGPTKLHNAILNVSDLRAGATLIVATTIANGESIVNGAEHIDRGYENIEGRFQQLGVDIKRVN